MRREALYFPVKLFSSPLHHSHHTTASVFHQYACCQQDNSIVQQRTPKPKKGVGRKGEEEDKRLHPGNVVLYEDTATQRSHDP